MRVTLHIPVLLLSLAQQFWAVILSLRGPSLALRGEEEDRKPPVF